MELSFRIMMALVLGCWTGLWMGDDMVLSLKTWVEPVGIIFINLIKMVIIPFVVSSIVISVANFGDTRRLGRVGLKMMLFYMITTILAMIIGVFAASSINPGNGFSLTAAESVKLKQLPGFIEFIINIPENPFRAMIENNMLGIVFFSVLMGLGICKSGEKGQPLLRFFDSVSEICNIIIGMLMRFAPYGVFALLVPVVAKNGMNVLMPMLSIIATMCIACLLHGTLVYASFVSIICKVNPLKFLRSMSAAMLLAFSTGSSAAALPLNIRICQEKLKLSKKITYFVLPMGAAVNMDGTAIYQGICAVFVANVYGIELTCGQLLLFVMAGTLSFIGTTSIPGSDMIMMALVLQTAGLPIEGLALVAGIDRILGMFRSCLNITGDSVAAMVLERSEQDNTCCLVHWHK